MLRLLETGLSSLHVRSFGHILPHYVLDYLLWGEDGVYHVAWDVTPLLFISSWEEPKSWHYRTSSMPLFHWIANEKHWILGHSMYMKGSIASLFPNPKFTFIWVGKRKSVAKNNKVGMDPTLSHFRHILYQGFFSWWHILIIGSMNSLLLHVAQTRQIYSLTCWPTTPHENVWPTKC